MGRNESYESEGQMGRLAAGETGTAKQEGAYAESGSDQHQKAIPTDSVTAAEPQKNKC